MLCTINKTTLDFLIQFYVHCFLHKFSFAELYYFNFFCFFFFKKTQQQYKFATPFAHYLVYFLKMVFTFSYVP